jgi:hypothetical protein
MGQSIEVQVAPWMLLSWCSRRFKNPKSKRFPISGHGVHISLLTEWADKVNPGDEIELFDHDLGIVLLSGSVKSVSKIPIHSLHLVTLIVFGWFLTHGQLIDYLSTNYQTEVNMYTIVSVIWFHVTQIFPIN